VLYLLRLGGFGLATLVPPRRPPVEEKTAFQATILRHRPPASYVSSYAAQKQWAPGRSEHCPFVPPLCVGGVEAHA
jgi:hypothetical protein